jgi:hypothetical protein
MRKVPSRVVLFPLKDRETIFKGVGTVIVSAETKRAFPNKTRQTIFIEEKKKFKSIPTCEVLKIIGKKIRKPGSVLGNHLSGPLT